MSSSTSDSEVLGVWAERLAAQLAPDEIDLAPDVLSAYLRGGAARRQLFAGPRADPGAFGAGLPLVLPYALDALADCYIVVKEFLGDPAVNSVILTANLVVALRQLRNTGSVRDGSATDIRAARQADEPTAEPEIVEPEIVNRAVTSVTALTARLERAPVPAAQLDTVAGEALTALVADPRGAIRFLDVIGKSAT
ncbi:MAG: hypothetical protein ACRDR6_14930 [Pseudonocardiaceae bacterium]